MSYLNSLDKVKDFVMSEIDAIKADALDVSVAQRKQIDDLQARLSQAEAERDQVKRSVGMDCMSHSCLYALNKSGMRVNGPCKCEPSRLKESNDFLYKQLDAATQERDRLVKVLSGEPCLESMQVKSGSPLEMELKHPMVHVMAEALANMCDGEGVENYIEIQCAHKTRGTFLVRVQRMLNPTPHELRRRAEHERDAAQKEVERLKKTARLTREKFAELLQLDFFAQKSYSKTDVIEALDKSEKQAEDEVKAEGCTNHFSDGSKIFPARDCCK